MAETVMSARVDDEVKARLRELAANNGKTLNQLLGELANNYLNTHDIPRIRAHTAIEKVDEKVKDALCPLCKAPLVYSKSLWNEEIKCSFPKCGTRDIFSDKFSLKKLMGELDYFRLLNLRRRAFIEKALKEQEKKEIDWSLY